MENVVNILRSNVRVLVCKKQMKKEPSNCTYCTFSMDCDAAFRVRDNDCGEKIAQNYANEGHNVTLSTCECEYNKIMAGTKVQLVKTRKDRKINANHDGLHRIGGDSHEDNHLWKRMGSDTAS